MKRKMTAIVVLLLSVLAAAPVLAETQYVIDDLAITLRRGEGEEYKILKMVKSGTPLEILGEGTNPSWLLVRDSSGTEGYVLKQYLTAQSPKAMVIARLEKERDRLKSTLDNLQGDRATLGAEMTQLRDRSAQLETELAQAQKELQSVRTQYQDLQEKSKNVVALSEERDRLQEENSRMTGELETLRSENEQLLLTGMIQWFLAGGGVFLVGWMIGKVSRKKKSRF